MQTFVTQLFWHCSYYLTIFSVLPIISFSWQACFHTALPAPHLSPPPINCSGYNSPPNTSSVRKCSLWGLSLVMKRHVSHQGRHCFPVPCIPATLWLLFVFMVQYIEFFPSLLQLVTYPPARGTGLLHVGANSSVKLAGCSPSIDMNHSMGNGR